MSCKLTLWENGVNGQGANETFTTSKGVDHNDSASAYSTEGDCSNTSWGLFEHNYEPGERIEVPGKRGPLGIGRGPPTYVEGKGTGIIIGKGDDAGGPLWNTHGEGKGSLNHRFYKIDDEISFVKKIEIPELPEGAIVEDMDIYGRRADAQGEWGHYPFVNSMDLNNPNHSQQHLTLEIKGSPCPGATAGVPIGHRTYRCVYANNNEIQMLYSGLSGEAADPRIDLYGRVVKKYCDDIENISKSVGGDLTCEDFGASREEWCSVDERIKTEPSCSKPLIGNEMYHRIAEAYCIANPGDEWCTCYNLKNNVCERTAIPMESTAAGCKHAHGIINENKKAFGPAIAMQSAESKVESATEGTPEHTEAVKNLAELKKLDGYPILVDNVHCRPDACESVLGGGYIPENPKGSCLASYNFCDQDIDIRNMSNIDIIIACNTGLPYVKPDWWDDPIVPYEKKRKFPYNKFPLNKTPMFKLPKLKKFRWKSKNDRYHAYSAGGVSVTSCLCCIIFMILMRTMSKRR
jgi:hypothetical protein